MKYESFTSKEIEVTGWLRRQLEIQAAGLSGNLDLVWPDIRDSAWIGGNREGWERVPYWLDGFIPLAYLLKNEDMIARAKKYIDAIIKNQKEDGWLCPCPDEARGSYDIWALFLICKVFVVYYECSGDERIKDVLYSALNNLYNSMKSGKIKLFNWGKFRWYESFVSIIWLYRQTKEDWLVELGKLIYSQRADYSSFKNRWELPINAWTYETHIVNIAMMLKEEALSCELLGGKYTDEANKFIKILSKYNGTAVGTFTGDECLSGISPIQGTELCAVVEQMYSYETLLSITGDAEWGEKLEQLAYNALPATFSDDMWSHQYDQMVNQIACISFPGRSLFRTNNSEAHIFGLEPHFGCCTANMSQGWPKFALSTFMRSENGIVSAVLAPSKVKTKIKDADVSIELKTDYPFKNEITYMIKTPKPVAFDFTIRIPSWSDKTLLNGKQIEKNGFTTIHKTWNCDETVTLSLHAVPEFVSRPNRMKVLTYGPFVMSLPIKAEWKQVPEYERNGVVRKFPYCDWELESKSDFNYAFAGDEFEILESEVGDVPFSSLNPPLKIKASMQKINWGYEDGFSTVCRKTPKSRKPISDKTDVLLQPYCTAKLRMTEMPKI